MISILTILKAAHALQRLVIALKSLCDGMIRCLPSIITKSRWFSNTRVMVSTRSSSSRRRNESLQQIAERLRSLPEVEHEPISSKLAAVLVPLFEDEEDGVVKVWLTQRAMHLNSHQGEVCLPGGKRDPSDPDDAFTAKREAQEEMGMQPDSVQVLCRLAPMLSKHLYSVTPVVAQVPADFQPVPNPEEVGAVFAMPLSRFLDAQHHIHWDVRSKSTSRKYYRVHSFDYQGFVVWGLTASILIHVAELALGRPPDFQVEHSSTNKPRM